MKTVHVKISGKVQGVWFRDSTRKQAESKGIVGWVKNTRDGCVEAIFQGDDAKVTDLIEWCQLGPPLSDVDHVDVTAIKADESLTSFSIRY